MFSTKTFVVFFIALTMADATVSFQDDFIYHLKRPAEIIDNTAVDVCQETKMTALDTDPRALKAMTETAKRLCSEVHEAPQMRFIGDLFIGAIAVNGAWNTFEIHRMDKEVEAMRKLLPMLLNITDLHNHLEIEREINERIQYYENGLQDLINNNRLTGFFRNRKLLGADILEEAGLENATLQEIAQALTPIVESCNGTSMIVQLCFLTKREHGRVVEVTHPGAFNDNKTAYHYYDLPLFYQSSTGAVQALNLTLCGMYDGKYRCAPQALSNHCVLPSGEGCNAKTEAVGKKQFLKVTSIKDYYLVATTAKKYYVTSNQKGVKKATKVPDSGTFAIRLRSDEMLTVAGQKFFGKAWDEPHVRYLNTSSILNNPMLKKILEQQDNAEKQMEKVDEAAKRPGFIKWAEDCVGDVINFVKNYSTYFIMFAAVSAAIGSVVAVGIYCSGFAVIVKVLTCCLKCKKSSKEGRKKECESNEVAEIGTLNMTVMNV